MHEDKREYHFFYLKKDLCNNKKVENNVALRGNLPSFQIAGTTHALISIMNLTCDRNRASDWFKVLKRMEDGTIEMTRICLYVLK